MAESHSVFYNILSFFFPFWYVFQGIKIALLFHLFHVTVTNASTNSLPGGKPLHIIVKCMK